MMYAGKNSEGAYPGLLIIGGTGRDSGKSLLASHLIAKYSHLNVYGVKITPHDHPDLSGLSTVAKGDDWIIYEEKLMSSSKDTSRMLRAGAAAVFLIVTPSRSPGSAFLALLPFLDASRPVICESPGLRREIEPGLFVIMQHPAGGMAKTKDISDLIPLADMVMTMEDIEKGMADRITVDENGSWRLLPADAGH